MRPEFKKEWLVEDAIPAGSLLRQGRHFRRRNERMISGRDLPQKGVIQLGSKTYVYNRLNKSADGWKIWIVGPDNEREENNNYLVLNITKYRIFDLGIDESNELGEVAP